MSIKVRNIKFQENPTSRNRADTCKHTDGQTDRRTDMAKLIGVYVTKGAGLKIQTFICVLWLKTSTAYC